MQFMEHDKIIWGHTNQKCAKMMRGKASKTRYVPSAVINGHEEGDTAECEG